MKIKLQENANDINELSTLSEWLYTNPKLTMGEKVKEFEHVFAEYIGVKHAIMTNSGSSANLLAVASLKYYKPHYYHFAIVPAISWSTTVAPYIQTDSFSTILCDCNLKNLGLDIDHLKKIIDEYHPTVMQVVNVLGFPNDYDEILEICKRYDITLLEDSCETLGSTYKGQMCGTFGDMSTFSFFYGHVISTIEGGMICTNNDNLNKILRMIRAHGWDRDISEDMQNEIRKSYAISDFHAFYTFYLPGYNVRPTEINAMLGLKQMEKLKNFSTIRKRNFALYESLLTQTTWRPEPDGDIVNFAYPMMVADRDTVVATLTANDVECRPIVCGSMNQQPFYKKHKYAIPTETPNADRIHEYGLYVPNHPGLSEDDIQKVCTLINEVKQ